MKRSSWSARRWRGAMVIAAACLVCGAGAAAAAQEPSADGISPLLKPEKAASKHARKHTEDSGPHPAASIPLGPLGFAAPNIFYLGDRLAQVSLNFLDEDSLLFTFRVPGLIARERSEAGEQSASESGATNPDASSLEMTQEVRNIRAVVLALPSGKVTAEATWRLHDFAPYLWMLDDGRFLLRDRKELMIGDSALRITPFLRFPGMLKYVELDPEGERLVAQSVEPRADSHNSEVQGTLGSDIASNAGAAGNSVLPSSGTSTGAVPRKSTETLLRVLRMRDRSVMLSLRTESGLVHLPIDGDGYYDAERGRGFNWLITYRSFNGAEEAMLPVESTCAPALDTLAPGVVLASACAEFGGRRLTVLTRGKKRLWDFPISPTRVWPTLARNRDGTRLARSTLDVMHPVGPTMPLDPTDIHGQTVQVFDVATGKVALTGPTSPVLDGGGGFALSPSGKRFAVLNEGAIQVYELPAPPPLPGNDGPQK
jgi:hypothetical protein